MDSYKNGWWIIPFKKFNRLSLYTIKFVIYMYMFSKTNNFARCCQI